MMINVGCGSFRAPAPWVNIDHTNLGDIRPDIMADARELPSEVNGVTTAYLGHFLEHIPEDEVVSVLKAIRERMVPGGRLLVVGPDVKKAAAMHDQGTLDTATFLAAHKSPDSWVPEWPGDVHHWDCNEEKVLNFLNAAGFSTVAIVPINSRIVRTFPVTALDAWQCAVIAIN